MRCSTAVAIGEEAIARSASSARCVGALATRRGHIAPPSSVERGQAGREQPRARRACARGAVETRPRARRRRGATGLERVAAGARPARLMRHRRHIRRLASGERRGCAIRASVASGITIASAFQQNDVAAAIRRRLERVVDVRRQASAPAGDRDAGRQVERQRARAIQRAGPLSWLSSTGFSIRTTA